ncbi:hypothetical protein [Ottowia sp.]|uniref:hypothetical protein n=1 Tax=Ottowia sp. TaxID=1898956 RepID=UPI002BF3BA7D|nr:hypothetical protein [Ottowia sp.]HPZ57558.1 hypothetical protein [Ottowia sp.]HQD49153.1 hypothetical protein [Ottowia sp.]
MAIKPDFFSKEALLGDGTTPGWGSLALGGANSFGNMFMGMKQYGLAKDTFEQNKKQFQLNYDAQKSMTNSQLADCQRSRNGEVRLQRRRVAVLSPA